MNSKPFFNTGATGSGYNINVDTLSFNYLNTGFVYLGATGLANVKQINSNELSNYAVTTAKIADSAVTSAKIASNINLSGIPTVDTAGTGTNTTQIANTAFVQDAVANLVNSAPSTLDTLNEISNALGNDNDFSTTITTFISEKVSKTGSEEISGVKTFTTLPESNATPTTNNQLTNKSYIDTQLQTIIFTQGITGTQGATGLQGEQGATGLQGEQGATGLQGEQGAQGFTGSQGAQGFTGSQGFIGAQGFTGSQGSQGFIGVQGFTGSTGFRGSTGSQGTQGNVGGTQGRIGTQGIQGNTGSQGRQGALGSQGFNGNTGSQGATGISSITIVDDNTNTIMYPIFINSTGTFSTLNIDSVTGPLTYNPNTSTFTCGSISLSNPILTTTTAAANSGQLGYIQTATLTTNQALTTGTLKNLGSITLAAGTWLIMFWCSFNRTTITYTGYDMEISSSSTAFDTTGSNVTHIKEVFTGAVSGTNVSMYNTSGVFYSGATGSTYYGNVSGNFSGTGSLVISTSIMVAIRLA